MTVSGPDFLALQVRDLDRAAAFYEEHLGLRRSPVSPPGAVVFDTSPLPFALPEPLPGVDRDARAPPPPPPPPRARAAPGRGPGRGASPARPGSRHVAARRRRAAAARHP